MVAYHAVYYKTPDYRKFVNGDPREEDRYLAKMDEDYYKGQQARSSEYEVGIVGWRRSRNTGWKRIKLVNGVEDVFGNLVREKTRQDRLLR